MTAAEREAADKHRRAADADRKARRRKRINDFVFARDGYRCVGCGESTDLTVDHIYPQALGGGSGGPEFPNLQTLCRPCNASKGIRLDWTGRRRRPGVSTDRTADTATERAHERWASGYDD